MMHHRAAAWPKTQVEKVRKLIMVGRGGKWLGTKTGAPRACSQGWMAAWAQQHLLRADFHLPPCCLVTQGDKVKRAGEGEEGETGTWG